MKIVIPIKKDDYKKVKMAVPYIEKYINADSIVIISNDQENIDSNIDIEYINENELYRGLTYNNLQTIIRKKTNKEVPVGYYFQQFLKMAFARVTTDNEYIVWDADTIPLQPITMKENDKYIFDMKYEYAKPYFNTIYSLFGIEKQIQGSFISEHMIINTGIMREIINEIEDNKELIGDSFYEKIINAISDDDIINGFSEFETYGSYVLNRHPGMYECKKYDSLRIGKSVVGEHPTEAQLEWVGKTYPAISIEHFDNGTWMSRLTRLKLWRRCFDAKFSMRLFAKINSLI